MAKAKTNQIANLDAVKKDNGKITEDGTKKEQGEKVVKEAFGVIIETNY